MTLFRLILSDVHCLSIAGKLVFGPLYQPLTDLRIAGDPRPAVRQLMTRFQVCADVWTPASGSVALTVAAAVLESASYLDSFQFLTLRLASYPPTSPAQSFLLRKDAQGASRKPRNNESRPSVLLACLDSRCLTGIPSSQTSGDLLAF